MHNNNMFTTHTYNSHTQHTMHTHAVCETSLLGTLSVARLVVVSLWLEGRASLLSQEKRPGSVEGTKAGGYSGTSGSTHSQLWLYQYPCVKTVLT